MQARSNDKGFTLVEVLIATLIMVVSIVTVTAAIRQFAIHREKLASYERMYTTVLSLRDRIMNENLTQESRGNGSLNGLPFSYQCRLEQTTNNYHYSEEVSQSGNHGPFAVSLFKVTLEVEGRSFEFYKTQYKKRYDSGKEPLI